MTRVRLIVAACFCVAFAAGIAAGVAFVRAAADATPSEDIITDDPQDPREPPERPARAPHSWLARELALTPEQFEQMRGIWEDALSHSRRAGREERRALREEREAKLMELLTEEQRQKYEDLNRWYEESTEALEAERRKRFEEAVEQTKAILDEEQRAKYEKIMQERGGRRRRPDPGDGPPPPPEQRGRPRNQ